MKIVQVDLRTISKAGVKSGLTTWLDCRPDLKVGAYVKLKDYMPRVSWEVVKIYDHTIKDAKDFDFHRKWDNNNYDKHKGLKLK